MNIARAVFGKGYAVIAFRRAPKQTTTTLFAQRNYAARQPLLAIPIPGNNKGRPNDETCKLEAKMQQVELGVISTPSRAAHQSAVKLVKSTNTSQIQIKKHLKRKKRNGAQDDFAAQGFYNVSAFSTAEEYDLESLLEGLTEQNLYTAKKFFSTDNLGVEQDVLFVSAKYKVDVEPRDIFFFREGSVVLWNFNDIETHNILGFLRPYEKDAYLTPLVMGESEIMPYSYIPEEVLDVEGDLVLETEVHEKAFFQDGKFYLTSLDDNFLQKYTFSNAMSTSIKLGMWEATLDRYIDAMEYLTEDLKKGRRIRISRADVLRKTGELFALRHAINLSSDLLDTPDFYWDREELEALYLQVCSYFSITRRTKVMNEKISHCVELAELITHNLDEAHHNRLEWMIIILILVEVAFECAHYMERYTSDADDDDDEDTVGQGYHLPNAKLL